MYVANSGSSTVSVIDGTTNTVVATIPVGSAPQGIAFNPDNGFLYVANQGSNTVSVIDGTTNTVTATIPVGSLPQSIAFNPDNGFMYVANWRQQHRLRDSAPHNHIFGWVQRHNRQWGSDCHMHSNQRLWQAWLAYFFTIFYCSLQTICRF